MSLLRISAISFLNTAPIMWDFENGETADRLRQYFEISYTIPSRCAEQLKEGSADIGIIPVAAYTVIPDLVIVPDVAIAAKNKVRSILLVSKVAINKIRSVATDDSSRTSAALVEKHAIGQSHDEIAEALIVLSRWLAKEQDEAGDWPGIDTLAPARSRKSRHGAILLPFRALLAAIETAG